MASFLTKWAAWMKHAVWTRQNETDPFDGGLITNGGMGLTTNWVDVGTPATNERSSAKAYAGTYSRYVNVTGAGNYGFGQAISKTSGKQYAISYSFWLVNNGNELYVYLENGDGTGKLIEDYWSVWGSWQTKNRTCSAETVTGAVGKLCFVASGGWSEFYIDNVRVTEI